MQKINDENTKKWDEDAMKEQRKTPKSVLEAISIKGMELMVLIEDIILCMV